MRMMLFMGLMFLLLSGCTSTTETIKTRPADETSSSLKNGSTIASANHLELGKMLHREGRWRQAIKHLTRSIAGDRENWEAHYYLGLCQQKIGRFDRAIGSFSNSLKYCTAEPIVIGNIYYGLGLSWEKEGYWHKAAETYATAQQLNPALVKAEAGLKRVEAKSAAAEAEKKKKLKNTEAF